jgi:cytochrome c oxidase subunit II
MLPAVPARARVLRRALLLSAAACAVGLAAAGPALAATFTPESGGSPNADDISSLFKLVLVVAVIVLVGVESLLLYTVIRFRRRKGMVAAQIHGNTRLEIGWTAGAAVIVVVLIVLAFTKLSAINDPPASGPNVLVPAAGGALVASYDQPPPPGGKGITIDVNGQQYVWRYTYPNGAFSYELMVAPVDTTVILKIRSQDVAHSWWIPQLGGKFDALPGYTNKTWFKIPASKVGTVFRGQCAELCGNGHANMFARVKAVTPAQFRAYMACQKLLIAQAQLATTPAKRNTPTPRPPAACAAAPSSG